MDWSELILFISCLLWGCRKCSEIPETKLCSNEQGREVITRNIFLIRVFLAPTYWHSDISTDSWLTWEAEFQKVRTSSSTTENWFHFCWAKKRSSGILSFSDCIFWWRISLKATDDNFGLCYLMGVNKEKKTLITRRVWKDASSYNSKKWSFLKSRLMRFERERKG